MIVLAGLGAIAAFEPSDAATLRISGSALSLDGTVDLKAPVPIYVGISGAISFEATVLVDTSFTSIEVDGAAGGLTGDVIVKTSVTPVVISGSLGGLTGVVDTQTNFTPVAISGSLGEMTGDVTVLTDFASVSIDGSLGGFECDMALATAAEIYITGELGGLAGDVVLLASYAEVVVDGSLGELTGAVTVLVDSTEVVVSGSLGGLAGTVAVTAIPPISLPITVSHGFTPGYRTDNYIEMSVNIPSDAYSAGRALVILVDNSDGFGTNYAGRLYFSAMSGLTFYWNPYYNPGTASVNFGDVSGSWLPPGLHTIRLGSVASQMRLTVDGTIRHSDNGAALYLPSSPAYITGAGFTLSSSPTLG